MISVGTIGKPHGIRGEVTVRIRTDDPNRFAAGATLRRESGELLTVSAARPNPKGGLIVAFEGVADRDAAEALRGVELLIDPAERRQLGPGEYWAEDLVGLEVLDVSGSTIGSVKEVEFAAQQRLLVVRPDGTEVLIPFVDELVPEVDIGRGRLVVAPIGGLIDEAVD